jgi:LAS superfamily LD-carboxypeptidase LdcB
MTAINNDMLTGISEQHLATRPDGFMLHQQVVQPFADLCQAAKTAGFDIKIVSAFRSYSRQAAIWNAKITGQRPVLNQLGGTIDITQLSGKAKLDAILLYSALPGASRHHWGTECDIYDAAAVPEQYKPQLLPSEYAAQGPFYRLQQWLVQHAADFGFFLPYATYQGGVAAEPWHLSYWPLANDCLASFNVEVLRQCLKRHPIEQQPLVITHLKDIVAQYVQNICPPPLTRP